MRDDVQGGVMDFAEFGSRLKELGVHSCRLAYGTSFSPSYRGITRAALRLDDVGQGRSRTYTDLDVRAFAAVDRWSRLTGNNGTGGGRARLPSEIRDAIESHPDAATFITSDGQTFTPSDDPEEWLRSRLKSPAVFAVLPVEGAKVRQTV